MGVSGKIELLWVGKKVQAWFSAHLRCGPLQWLLQLLLARVNLSIWTLSGRTIKWLDGLLLSTSQSVCFPVFLSVSSSSLSLFNSISLPLSASLSLCLEMCMKLPCSFVLASLGSCVTVATPAWILLRSSTGE